MLTRRGWAAFGAGISLWIVARFVGSPDLHMVAAGIAVMPFLAAGFVHWSNVRLEVHRTLSMVRVFPGTRVTVSLTITNNAPQSGNALSFGASTTINSTGSANVIFTGPGQTTFAGFFSNSSAAGVVKGMILSCCLKG